MNSQHTLVKMVMDRWYSLIQMFDKQLNALSDEDLNREISAGKNRGIYVLGHLIAVHDNMLPLLNMGDKVFPEFHQLFIDSPDKFTADLPSAAQLRTCWNKMNAHMKEKFDALSPEAWFERHTAVAEDEFLKEPHRNKLNIVLTRASHLSYHNGQFVLLKK